MVRLDIEIWVIGRGGTKKKGSVSVGKRYCGCWVLCFVCVLVYFCCYSGGFLCQGLQGAGVVYRWYSRLVCGW
jgi:hypothetical protein